MESQFTQNHTVIRPVIFKIKDFFRDKFKDIVVTDILVKEGQFLYGKNLVIKIDYTHVYDINSSTRITDSYLITSSIGLVKEVLVKPGDVIDINTPLFMIEHYCYNRDFYNDYDMISKNIISEWNLINDRF